MMTSLLDLLSPALARLSAMLPGGSSPARAETVHVRPPRPGQGALAKIRLAVLVVALPLSMLVGCGKAQINTPDAVVMVASATANEPAPVLSGADREFLYEVGANSADGVAYVVNPSTGQPVVVTLTPRRADGQIEYAQPRRDQLLDANVDRVQQALDRDSASGPFDLLADIAAAARVTAGSATMLVISSGVSTAGGLNLTDVGWGADPRLVATQLRSRGLLPDLAGWRVVFSGLGDTAGRQTALPLPQRTMLISYWMAICRAANATSCTVDEMTRPEPPSNSTTPVPVVPVPQVVSVQGPPGWIGESVPADEFFTFDSSQLLPGADAILAPLAARARAQHLLVSITGYASPDGGSNAYNLALSYRRVLAVRARLIALGVSASQIVTCTGLGTDGVPPSSCYSGGQLDESICAQFRRVVILFNSTAAASL